MVYVDRVIIGGVMSLTVVTYNVTSYELETRAWALAGAVMDVLFPLRNCGSRRRLDHSRHG